MTELKLEELTLEQKIGLTIVARCIQSEEDKQFIFSMLDKKAVGGIQVRYDDNCRELIAQIKERAGYPILICEDMEHGFPGSKLSIPDQLAISATDSEEFAYEFGRVTAIEAKNAGYNVVWGPVVDFAKEGALCSINRCLSDDKETITKYASAIVRGYQDEGMVCTAKHFPGGLDTFGDSHIEYMTSKHTKEELLNTTIYPYIELIKNENLSGIMTRHCVFENIDPDNISTFSKKVTGIIREIGFEGVIMTDSLAMMAIVQKYGMGESVPLALAAGNDMILPNYRLSFKESYDYMMEGYKSGLITDERLNDAVYHVLEAQRRTLKCASQKEVSDYQKNLMEETSKRCLCAITQPGTEVKLNEDTKKFFVILCENEYPDTPLESRELTIPDWFSRKNAERKRDLLLKAFPGSSVYIMTEFPNQVETEQVCRGISEADEAIFFTFCRTSSYLGSDSLTRRMEYIIKANSEKISTVVHLGNPYELKKFKGIERIIYGVNGGTCAEYAIDALKGEFIPTGKVPVKLD